MNDDVEAKETSASNKQHSKTKVNKGLGVWGNKRRVVGIRVDEKLYLAFKPVAKRVFGSVCRPIEAFMASVVAIAETNVNFGNTIEVHEIKIERNLRARRGLVPAEVSKSICGFVNCHRKAVGKGVWREKRELLLCEDHLAEAKGNPREWKVLAHG